MIPIRILLLIVLAAALVSLAILTWGSLGSAVCLYSLIVMASALLVKKFLINRDADDFQMED